MSERRGSAAAGKRSAARAKPTSQNAAAQNAGNSEPTPQPPDRSVRRAVFLAELAEAKELRKRVAPRRARAAELHARLLRTFRY